MNEVDSSLVMETINKMKLDGCDRLHILADFDKTLTKAWCAEGNRLSLVSILRDSGLMSKEYDEDSRELWRQYDKYEKDLSIPEDERIRQLTECAEKKAELLVTYGFRKSMLEEIASRVQFREGTFDLLELAYSKDIPFIVLSASGLGSDAIRACFKAHGKMYDNIHIISNTMEWDGEGNALGFHKPLIHSMNKDESALEDFPEVGELISKRKNVLLLGDSLGDRKMVGNFQYDNLLSVGFLNNNVDELKGVYASTFDHIICGDGSMREVYEILSEICLE